MRGLLQLSLMLLGSCHGSASHTFLKYEGHPSATISSSKSFVVKSKLQCANVCIFGDKPCKGFSYNETDGECVIGEHVCAISVGYVKVDRNTIIRTQLALGKPAEMSSDLGPYYDYAGYVASVGNDGVYHRTATWDSYDVTGVSLFFHTAEEQDPWWRVDLEENYCVSSVYFLNRGYELWERTKNVVVTVALLQTDLDDKVNNMCGEVVGEADRWDNLVTCSLPLIGRYVQLKCEAMTAFHLYEVEVHGY